MYPATYTPATATIMTGVYRAGGHVKGRKERRGSIAFILMIKTGQCPTIGQADPVLRTLQGLNVRLFVYAASIRPWPTQTYHSKAVKN